VLEYREPLVPGMAPDLVVAEGEGGLDLALRTGATVHFLAAVRPRCWQPAPAAG
jgi:hypothetical protein